jgi:hypothetical protein
MQVSGQPHAPAALQRGRNPGTRWIGSWEVPRVSVDAVVKRWKLTVCSVIMFATVDLYLLYLYVKYQSMRLEESIPFSCFFNWRYVVTKYCDVRPKNELSGTQGLRSSQGLLACDAV